MELELKLQMTADDQQALKGAAWLKADQAGPTRTRLLKATYFDTPDFEVKRAGCTLRVRKEGRQYVQCLKSRSDSTCLLAREEHETVVKTPRLDMEALTDSGLTSMLKSDSWNALNPLFTTEIRRTIKHVRRGQTLIEVSFDHGTIAAGDASTTICETELELIDGEVSVLLELAREIVEATPCRLVRQGKADAGYNLLGQSPPTWSRPSKLELPAECKTEEAMSTICMHSLEHLQANEECVLTGKHPEGVHQMRVAVRRLRSMLSIYKTLLPDDQRQELNQELRWLGNSLSPARDWDVFIQETLKPAFKSMAEESALESLRSLARQQRTKAYKKAHRALKSKRYTLLLLRISSWLEGQEWRQQQLSEEAIRLFSPATEFASILLTKRQNSLRKKGRNFKKLDPVTRHDLRIEAKKLRYATEFFCSLMDSKAATAYQKALARLQDDLGQYNDIIVARQLLTTMMADVPEKERDQISYAAGLIMGWHHHLASGLNRRQEKSWNRFKKTKPFW